MTRGNAATLVGAAGTLALLWIALVVGPGGITTADVWAVLWGRAPSALAHALVWDLRLPRSLLAIVIGASLSVAGAITQGLFRNPLAEPGVLGVSAGAAMAAALGLAWGLDAWGPWTIAALACGGAMAVLGLLMAWARHDARVSTLLLCGVALASMAGAVTALVLSVGIERWEVGVKVVRWLMGSFEGRSWQHLGLGATALALGAGIAGWLRRDLDALALGHDTAASLGVNLRATWRWGVLAVGVLAGMATALTGVIGFVGLVVPHLARSWVGPSHRKLLPAAAILGGGLLLAVDLATRTVTVLALPPGAVTSLLGTPVFLWVLRRLRTEVH